MALKCARSSHAEAILSEASSTAARPSSKCTSSGALQEAKTCASRVPFETTRRIAQWLWAPQSPASGVGTPDRQPPARPTGMALLLLLPLTHAVRIVTPFRTGPVCMAASLPSVDPALKLVLRAAGDRGKADLSSLRALAGLIGMDDGLRALEKQLGISEDATDADIQARALILAQPRPDPDPSPKAPGRPDPQP